MFSCEFCEIFKNTVFTEHLGTTAYIIIIDVITHLKTLSFYKLYLIILWNTQFQIYNKKSLSPKVFTVVKGSLVGEVITSQWCDQ